MDQHITTLIADIHAAIRLLQASKGTANTVRVNPALLDTPERRTYFEVECQRLGLKVKYDEKHPISEADQLL